MLFIYLVEEGTECGWVKFRWWMAAFQLKAQRGKTNYDEKKRTKYSTTCYEDSF